MKIISYNVNNYRNLRKWLVVVVFTSLQGNIRNLSIHEVEVNNMFLRKLFFRDFIVKFLITMKFCNIFIKLPKKNKSYLPKFTIL